MNKSDNSREYNNTDGNEVIIQIEESSRKLSQAPIKLVPKDLS